jgi:hypothetical protein
MFRNKCLYINYVMCLATHTIWMSTRRGTWHVQTQTWQEHMSSINNRKDMAINYTQTIFFAACLIPWYVKGQQSELTKNIMESAITNNWNRLIFTLGQDDLTAVVWRDGYDVHVLTGMHHPQITLTSWQACKCYEVNNKICWQRSQCQTVTQHTVMKMNK